MIIATLLAVSSLAFFQSGGKGDTVVEFSKPQKGEAMSTVGYAESSAEQSYSKKVTEKPIRFKPKFEMPKAANMTDEEWAKFKKEEKEREDREKGKVIPDETYQLADQVGAYVGWFGIVRSVSFDPKAGSATLTLEHKYFDGLVDGHQMIVSLHGAGDFTAALRKKDAAIQKLALVRVYGKVSKEKDGTLRIAAEFVRVWDWGLFAFMDYGKDKSNAKWVSLRSLADDKTYSSNPDDAYYQGLLGPRK
jgi:hypothetical protein